ncbi:MAG: sterol desaturase family protein [Bdellovibrionales bacterium]|nr:sterol desaturase family protein [Bdellovibrionales bacterium]
MSTKAHQSIRLFKNPVLEALTHVHPSLPFIIWIPVVAYLWFQSRASMQLDYSAIALYSVLGLFFWTFTEYAMHRYVFHYDASTKAGKYLVFLFHGIHHDDPQDPTRLVMPPVVSITLGIAFFYLFKVVFADNGTPFFCGFIVGYMIYDYIHFAVHHFRPRTAWGKALKEHHMKHHFIAHGAKWGVSSMIWDRVFRTMS